MASLPRRPELAVDTHSLSSHPYWHEIRTLGAHPHRRSYHSAVAWENKIVVCGGQDLREGMVPGHWIFSFDENVPELDTWTELPVTDNAPPALCRQTAVIDHGRMFLFGGTDNSIENAVTFILDLSTLNWTIKPPESQSLPPPMDSHTAIAWNGEMIVFGGFVRGSRSNQVFCLKLSSLSWSVPTVSGPPPTPRSSHSSILHHNDMFIYGGCNDEGGKLADIMRLRLPSYSWESISVSGALPEGRSGHSAVLYKSIMLVFGGMKDLTKETNEMFGLNLETMEWGLIQEERKIEDPVSAAQLEEYKKGRSPNRKPTVGPGGGSPNTSSPSMHKGGAAKHDSPVSPGDDSPTMKKKKASHLYEGPPTPLLGRIVGRAPYPRDGHSSVLLGDRMFVFGGDRYQMPFNDLYVFAVNDYSVKAR